MAGIFEIVINRRQNDCYNAYGQVMNRGHSSKTYTVAQAASLLGISPKGVYSAIRRGSFDLPHLVVGRRIVIPRAPLHKRLGLAEDAEPLKSGSAP